MLLYATWIVCAVLTAVLVYRYDLYDREPIPVILVAIALGYGFMWGLGPAEAFVIEDALGSSGAGAIALTSALLEELAKLAVVVAIARLVPATFDEPMDGIIYGSMAGLGAALQESSEILWALDSSEMLPPAEIVRLFGHLVMGGMAGMGVGLMVVGHASRYTVLAFGFGAAVLLHFVWDYVALVTPINTDDLSYVLVRCAVMAGGLVAYGWIVAQFSRLSREYVDPDSKARLWGWPFVRNDEG